MSLASHHHLSPSPLTLAAGVDAGRDVVVGWVVAVSAATMVAVSTAVAVVVSAAAAVVLWSGLELKAISTSCPAPVRWATGGGGAKGMQGPGETLKKTTYTLPILVLTDNDTASPPFSGSQSASCSHSLWTWQQPSPGKLRASSEIVETSKNLDIGATSFFWISKMMTKECRQELSAIQGCGYETVDDGGGRKFWIHPPVGSYGSFLALTTVAVDLPRCQCRRYPTSLSTTLHSKDEVGIAAAKSQPVLSSPTFS